MRLSRRHQEWTGLVPVRAWAGSAGGINQEGGLLLGTSSIWAELAWLLNRDMKPVVCLSSVHPRLSPPAGTPFLGGLRMSYWRGPQ